MAVDLKKLQAYLQAPPMPVDPSFGSGLDPDEAYEIREGLENEASELSQTARLLSPMVAYMELTGGAKFRCGDCQFATDALVCIHPMVRASVSADGCCSLYQPINHHNVTFPPSDEEDEEEDEEEEGEEAEEDEHSPDVY